MISAYTLTQKLLFLLTTFVSCLLKTKSIYRGHASTRELQLACFGHMFGWVCALRWIMHAGNWYPLIILCCMQFGFNYHYIRAIDVFGTNIKRIYVKAPQKASEAWNMLQVIRQNTDSEHWQVRQNETKTPSKIPARYGKTYSEAIFGPTCRMKASIKTLKNSPVNFWQC